MKKPHPLDELEMHDLLRLLRHPEQENRLTQGWRADLIGQALQSEASI